MTNRITWIQNDYFRVIENTYLKKQTTTILLFQNIKNRIVKSFGIFLCRILTNDRVNCVLYKNVINPIFLSKNASGVGCRSPPLWFEFKNSNQINGGITSEKL